MYPCEFLEVTCHLTATDDPHLHVDVLLSSRWERGPGRRSLYQMIPRRPEDLLGGLPPRLSGESRERRQVRTLALALGAVVSDPAAHCLRGGL
jgi:hypothetical protein